MTDAKQPLLSICIPTFNRAACLRSAIWALVSQVKEMGDLVELVISDNCSMDQTSEVIAWGQQYVRIQYNRNDTNLGFECNLLLLTNSLAKGEYCWVLGDDDIVREHGVKSIIEAIQKYPYIDYLFVNHSYEHERSKKSNDQNTLITGADFSELRNPLCWDMETKIVQHWEKIIKFSRVPALFTSIVSHVFRRNKWNEFSSGLNIIDKPPHSSLEMSIPHACIVARMMVGRPAVYIGYPHVIMFVGNQLWFDQWWPMIQVIRALELSDLFESLGAEKQMVDLYRNVVFKNSSHYFWRLLTDSSLESRQYFSLATLIKRYWKYKSFWAMVSGYRALASLFLKKFPYVKRQILWIMNRLDEWTIDIM
jgi:glycosyltransferase involved in cell wall biosynthesis